MWPHSVVALSYLNGSYRYWLVTKNYLDDGTMMMTIMRLIMTVFLSKYELSFATNRRGFTIKIFFAVFCLSLSLYFILFIYFREKFRLCVCSCRCVYKLNKARKKKTFKLRFTCFVHSVQSEFFRRHAIFKSTRCKKIKR